MTCPVCGVDKQGIQGCCACGYCIDCLRKYTHQECEDFVRGFKEIDKDEEEAIKKVIDAKEEKVTKHKCGHNSNLIIMDSNLLSVSAYVDWLNSVGFQGSCEKCFDCYCKEKKIWY